MAHEARRSPLITPPPGLFGLHIVRPVEVPAPEVPEELNEAVVHEDEAHQPDGVSPDKQDRRLSMMVLIGVAIVLIPLALAVLLNRGGLEAVGIAAALLVLYIALGVFPVWNAARERAIERMRVEKELREQIAAGRAESPNIEVIERD